MSDLCLSCYCFRLAGHDGPHDTERDEPEPILEAARDEIAAERVAFQLPDARPIEPAEYEARFVRYAPMDVKHTFKLLEFTFGDPAPDDEILDAVQAEIEKEKI